MLVSNSLVILTWCFSEVLLFISAPWPSEAYKLQAKNRFLCQLNSFYVFGIFGRGLAVTYKWLLCFCNSFSHPNLLFWSSRFALAKDNSSLCSKATMIWGIVERLFAVGGCCSLLCPTATTFKMSQWLDTVNQLLLLLPIWWCCYCLE